MQLRRKFTARHILLLILLVGGPLLFVSHRLQKSDEDVKRAWAELSAQCEQRRNLLSNFSNAVRYYVKGEDEIWKMTLRARDEASFAKVAVTELSDRTAVEKFKAAQENISKAINGLEGAVRRHPKLSENLSFRDLVIHFNHVESTLTEKNSNYLSAVRHYNQLVKRFPSNIVAKYIQHAPARYELQVESREFSGPGAGSHESFPRAVSSEVQNARKIPTH